MTQVKVKVKRQMWPIVCFVGLKHLFEIFSIYINAHVSSPRLSRVYNYGSFSQDVEIIAISKWKNERKSSNERIIIMDCMPIVCMHRWFNFQKICTKDAVKIAHIHELNLLFGVNCDSTEDTILTRLLVP